MGLLALLILGGCDHMSVTPESSDAARIATAQAYYEHAIVQPPAEAPAPRFPFSLVKRRPPDWSTAQVLQHRGPVVAAQLRGNALRTASDTQTSLGMVVFEMGPEGQVATATILEFIVPASAPVEAFTHYLMRYWEEDFQEHRVAVAAFSLYYDARRGTSMSQATSRARPPSRYKLRKPTKVRTKSGATTWFGTRYLRLPRSGLVHS